MNECAHASVLLLASDAELPADHRVWGTGGWTRPEDREALDWLALCRLMGWGVRVLSVGSYCGSANVPEGISCIIIACDPDSLSEDLVSLLASEARRVPLLVVARVGRTNSPFARLSAIAPGTGKLEGQSLRWTGPGGVRDWHCPVRLEATVLEVSAGTAIWGTLDGAPVIVARSIGRGMIATLGFHPGQARDTDGTATALLRQLLVCGAPAPVAYLDFEGTLVLRMDDPGGSQNIHSRSWSSPKLTEKQWAAIGADLSQRQARLSIAYVAGWVDEGDAERGELVVAGRTPWRVPGAVYESPQVRYRDLAGHLPGVQHDYESEFRGIQLLRAAGLADVELHGFTHMHPDRAAWAQAADRYERNSWYREFGNGTDEAIAALSPAEHPLVRGFAALRRHFNGEPTTFIPPGDEWTSETLERALDLGLQLVNSYYLALRDGDRFCWSVHVCAPYLDQPDSAWFNAGLPVIGYFHDRELALEGIDWMRRWLDGWQAAGARRLIDFRELAGAVGRRLRLERRAGGLHLTVVSEGAVPLVRPLPIILQTPGEDLPARLAVTHEGCNMSLPVQCLGPGLGRIIVPASNAMEGPP